MREGPHCTRQAEARSVAAGIEALHLASVATVLACVCAAVHSILAQYRGVAVLVVPCHHIGKEQ